MVSLKTPDDAINSPEHVNKRVDRRLSLSLILKVFTVCASYVRIWIMN